MSTVPTVASNALPSSSSADANKKAGVATDPIPEGVGKDVENVAPTAIASAPATNAAAAAQQQSASSTSAAAASTSASSPNSAIAPAIEEPVKLQTRSYNVYSPRHEHVLLPNQLFTVEHISRKIDGIHFRVGDQVVTRGTKSKEHLTSKDMIIAAISVQTDPKVAIAVGLFDPRDSQMHTVVPSTLISVSGSAAESALQDAQKLIAGWEASQTEHTRRQLVTSSKPKPNAKQKKGAKAAEAEKDVRRSDRQRKPPTMFPPTPQPPSPPARAPSRSRGKKRKSRAPAAAESSEPDEEEVEVGSDAESDEERTPTAAARPTKVARKSHSRKAVAAPSLPVSAHPLPANPVTLPAAHVHPCCAPATGHSSPSAATAALVTSDAAHASPLLLIANLQKSSLEHELAESHERERELREKLHKQDLNNQIEQIKHSITHQQAPRP